MSSELLILVEDQAVTADAVAAHLEMDGYRVKTLNSGLEVIATVAQWSPAAVIMDISLPDVDGVTIAQLIRRIWPGLPIIFTTGHADYRGLEELLDDGRTFLLRKPFEITALIVLLSRLTRS